MTKLIETTIILSVLALGVLSLGHLAKHSHKAKIGIERHLLGK